MVSAIKTISKFKSGQYITATHKYFWSSLLTQKLDRAMTKGFDNASDRSGLHTNGLRFRKEISQNFFYSVALYRVDGRIKGHSFGKEK